MADDSLSQVRAVLRATPARWEALTEALPEALLRRPPAPGEWSALECLLHLLDTERGVFPVRVRAFLAGQSFQVFTPETQGAALDDRAPIHYATAFARYRLESLALLDQLAPADLARGATHPELGPVTLGQQLAEWAAHDLMHTVQGERALMQPFIVGSGAWRGYFADHDVGGQ